MGKFLIGALLGLVVGGAGAMMFGGGAAMGVGVAAGLSTGVCATMKAAQEESLITPEQVDQVLNRVNSEMAALQGEDVAQEVAGSAQACDEFLTKLVESN